MCGRYALFTDSTDLADEFDLADATYERTYNAAPSEDLPVVLDDEPERLTAARWGLVPSWSDGPGGDPDPINARAETLSENRYFREAYRERRCLVPVDGFYEWVETADGKQPHYVSRADGRPFLLAGLWETWTPEQKQTGLGEFDSGGPSKAAETVRSFTVVTTEPNDFLAEYHHRMALLLDRERGERWLTADDPSDLLAPSGMELRAWPVSRAVNDPSNDRPELVESVA
ncbi:SOS response-associated peptidase [Halobacterium wangiae]|uniref:SOS response-associated peptidase n=1 Tax=Halobacterium wangiae TaxID=2902623 RepID=UPI001E5EF440|nr:SOS response-associated peptidase [Halobacterium wangiae]